MNKKVSITIIVLLVILSVMFNHMVPVHSKMTSSAAQNKNYKIKYISSKNDYKFLDFKGPVLVAHRGANKIAPENSIPAIDAAGRMGYWGVELDVCSSSDGVLYLLHDGTLNRTTTGKGSITKKTSAQISKYRIDRGPNISLYHDLKIPRFEDALTECEKNHLVPIFELKSLSSRNRDINTFIRIIKKHGYENKLLVHSFHFDDLQYLRSKDKEILTMPIVDLKKKSSGYQYVKYNGFEALDCNYNQLTKAIVQKAHKDGLKVFCWVVDKRSGLDKVTNMGVDFICTDSIYPDHDNKQI